MADRPFGGRAPQDGELVAWEEIELLAEAMIAAAHTEGPLSAADLDRTLGVRRAA